MIRYNADIGAQMQKLYNSLNEKDKRRYAASEALKPGYGGKKYICDLFGCDLKTLNRGISDLNNAAVIRIKRIGKKGGGRKSVLKQKTEINGIFLQVIHDRTAGSPTDEKIRRTNLTSPQPAGFLSRKGYKVSVTAAAQLLKKHNFRKRRALKSIKGGEAENRNGQFPNISRLCAEYRKAGMPVLSMDVKKKELTGNFYRDGHFCTQEQVKANDHDFRSPADGTAVPHGLIMENFYIPALLLCCYYAIPAEAVMPAVIFLKNRFNCCLTI